VKPVRIGCVKYLNARPLIYGWSGGAVDLDHPAALCRKLDRGDLDVALVSSLELLCRPIYRIVDGVSISSRGEVYSVIVAHGGDLTRIEQIELDSASETSVALLRCLLAQRGLSPRLVPSIDFHSVRVAGLQPAAQPQKAWLLIGDQAVRFRQENRRQPVWDLGEEWSDVVHLPFVFALWLIRPEVSDAEEIADALRQLRDRNLHNLDDLVSSQTQVSAEFCRKYYREHLFFDFGEREKAGLREFHRRCLANKIDVASEMPLTLV
jgi:chorismate dehydratase